MRHGSSYTELVSPNWQTTARPPTGTRPWGDPNSAVTTPSWQGRSRNGAHMYPWGNRFGGWGAVLLRGRIRQEEARLERTARRAAAAIVVRSSRCRCSIVAPYLSFSNNGLTYPEVHLPLARTRGGPGSVRQPAVVQLVRGDNESLGRRIGQDEGGPAGL